VLTQGPWGTQEKADIIALSNTKQKDSYTRSLCVTFQAYHYKERSGEWYWWNLLIKYSKPRQSSKPLPIRRAQCYVNGGVDSSPGIWRNSSQPWGGLLQLAVCVWGGLCSQQLHDLTQAWALVWRGMKQLRLFPSHDRTVFSKEDGDDIQTHLLVHSLVSCWLTN
jgi:hypothetical protein